jgi:ribonucleoside-triphosphate reductase
MSNKIKQDGTDKDKTRDMFFEIISAKPNDITRENANMNTATPAGMMMKFASESSKPFASEYLLSEEAREAHTKGYIHIHDLDYYPSKSLTCVHYPLDKILQNGFSVGHGVARPARRIETASTLTCIAMEICQNEMHGGQSIPAFDFYMAPYVRLTFIEEVKKVEEYDNEDYSQLYHAHIAEYTKTDGLPTGTQIQRAFRHAINKTVDRVHQAMESFIHNLNSIHSRGGNQVVFSSINYGTATSMPGLMLYSSAIKCLAAGRLVWFRYHTVKPRILVASVVSAVAFVWRERNMSGRASRLMLTLWDKDTNRSLSRVIITSAPSSSSFSANIRD